MTPKDLVDLKSLAIRFYKDFPAGSRLHGMSGALDESDIRALAFYDAALTILNRQGALKDGWVTENKLPLVQIDSEPDHEDYL